MAYLRRLSADAEPALDRLPEQMRACAMASPGRDDDDWRSWNAARSWARQALAPVPATNCRLTGR